MSSLIDNVPFIPHQYVVAADRVTVAVPLAGGSDPWLDDVDCQPSLLDALLCLLECPLPVIRQDLKGHRANLNERTIRAWYKYTADAITLFCPHFPVGSQQWQDACAIRLYTYESPICYMIDGMATQHGRVVSDWESIAPLARRLFDGVRHLGVPYVGSAFRVMFADTPLLQTPYAEYKTHFAVGRPVNFYQFASFTTDMEQLQSFTRKRKPMIVLKCSNVNAFDVNEYSDPHTEAEVLVLPNSYFVVKSAPHKFHDAVIVEVEYLPDASSHRTSSGPNHSVTRSLRDDNSASWCPDSKQEQCSFCYAFDDLFPVAFSRPAHIPFARPVLLCFKCVSLHVQEFATVSQQLAVGLQLPRRDVYVVFDRSAAVQGIPPPPSVIADVETMNLVAASDRDTIRHVLLVRTASAGAAIQADTLPRLLQTFVSTMINDNDMCHILTLGLLQHLNISGSTRITPVVLQSIGSLRQIQRLVLRECCVTNAVLAEIARCQETRYLDLDKCGVTDDGLRSLAPLKKLELLSLRDCCDITDAGLESISIFSQLQELYLRNCIKLTDASVANISRAQRLRALSLVSCDKITDASIVSIVSLTHLQLLYLGSCDMITDAGLLNIASLTHLRLISLYSCGKITDDSLASIARLSQLQRLYLGLCDKITDAGLVSIASLTQLHELYLGSCNKITDVGLISIASLTQLKLLDLNSCNKITDAGLVSIARLTQLEQLYLSSCNEITDAGLAIIASLTQLRVLNLSSCSKITNIGLVREVTKIAMLCKLILKFCNHISDDAVLKISKVLLGIRCIR
ncbi:receptor-type protein kinase, putative [Bodo saltans]|uniref:Receptor-type protein kinase, putative n=1 Tax=Bodo saltans TaxID=75058 RepID=A0A0S4J8Z1_BODSA|nr:receptor-type protein kinase, putative [Bodo saltans]|eukprot:CUG86414.1 receptor-type protein kinase, putative [Bodo saltans]